MKRKRRAFSEKFKAKVAIDAIKGIKTISQLATEYKVHPNQISIWKKQLLLNAEELFATGRKSGKGELFSPPPHTTLHAGPHRAVHYDRARMNAYSVSLEH
jgi:putative transposase